MPPASDIVSCSNPDCRIATDGKCVEGVPLDQCKFYGKAPASDEPQAERPGSAPPPPELADANSKNLVQLSSGEKLSIEEAARILRARESRVIAMVAPSNAGKTSLIGTIYELFQRGPVAGFQFARTQTFYDFERFNHLARAESRGPEPDYEHTYLPEGLKFFHLGLQDSRNKAKVELLVSDRSGESFRNATDDLHVASEFVELESGDVLSFLVDGDRLAGDSTRHNLLAETRLIFQALADSEMLRHEHRVALVLTKCDIIEQSELKTRTEADYARLANDIQRTFGDRFELLECFRVAASPHSDVLPRGHGLHKLLAFWLKPPLQLPSQEPPAATPSRAFARFTNQTRISGS